MLVSFVTKRNAPTSTRAFLGVPRLGLPVQFHDFAALGIQVPKSPISSPSPPPATTVIASTTLVIHNCCVLISILVHLELRLLRVCLRTELGNDFNFDSILRTPIVTLHGAPILYDLTGISSQTHVVRCAAWAKDPAGTPTAYLNRRAHRGKLKLVGVPTKQTQVVTVSASIGIFLWARPHPRKRTDGGHVRGHDSGRAQCPPTKAVTGGRAHTHGKGPTMGAPEVMTVGAPSAHPKKLLLVFAEQIDVGEHEACSQAAGEVEASSLIGTAIQQSPRTISTVFNATHSTSIAANGICTAPERISQPDSMDQPEGGSPSFVRWVRSLSSPQSGFEWSHFSNGFTRSCWGWEQRIFEDQRER
ncbi:hypothetical protein C8R45DRAFT_944307 [Mycena sanguinolenta]|nr:hypothetical protein C8R45DRAFT_944307 [Mycena sanguinolenta]